MKKLLVSGEERRGASVVIWPTIEIIEDEDEGVHARLKAIEIYYKHFPPMLVIGSLNDQIARLERQNEAIDITPTAAGKLEQVSPKVTRKPG